MDVTKNVKKAAAGTAMAGALGFGLFGAGSGIAAAKPDNPHPNPHRPGVSAPANPGSGDQNGHGGQGNGAGNGYSGDDRDDNGGGYGAGDRDGNVNSTWRPGLAPGQNPFGPPGQVKQMTNLTFNSDMRLSDGLVIPAGTVLPGNPFRSIPPGHWGTVDLARYVTALNPTTITWLPVGSDLTIAQQLGWNAAANGGQGAWGVTLSTGQFIPYPIRFPAPTTG